VCTASFPLDDGKLEVGASQRNDVGFLVDGAITNPLQLLIRYIADAQHDTPQKVHVPDLYADRVDEDNTQAPRPEWHLVGKLDLYSAGRVVGSGEIPLYQKALHVLELGRPNGTERVDFGGGHGECLSATLDTECIRRRGADMAAETAASAKVARTPGARPE
jgi:hypothetical protein